MKNVLGMLLNLLESLDQIVNEEAQSAWRSQGSLHQVE
jgi:hypothetical protein